MTDSETFYAGLDNIAALDDLISFTSNLTEEQYLICRGHIGGFSFNEKKWEFFNVDDIELIEFNEKIFSSSLMLEDRYKNILLSLIRMQSVKSEESFHDIIKGKGNGVVFLLHGEPGVGKTMTAGSYLSSPPAGWPIIPIENLYADFKSREYSRLLQATASQN